MHMSPVSVVQRLPSSHRAPSAAVCPTHAPAWQWSAVVHSFPSPQTMFSFPAAPTHFGLPDTIAHRSLIVQTFPSSQIVPTAAAVVPAAHAPLLQVSPVVHGFASHSRAPVNFFPPAHLVTLLPDGSLPRRTHVSLSVQGL